MFKILSIIGSLWRVIKWIRQQRAEMESDIDGYFSNERAAQWRLNIEKVFMALEKGNGASVLPISLQKLCEWLFAKTKVDNCIGSFGQALLKSGKIERNDTSLREPVL